MLQFTPELEASFATVAVKACDPPTFRETVSGLTATLIAAGAEPLLPQPAKARIVNATTKNEGIGDSDFPSMSDDDFLSMSDDDFLSG
jgi:hypothetical protein